MEPRMTKKQRVFYCIREYHKAGLIINNEISKSVAKKYYKANLEKIVRMPFMFLMHSKVLLHPSKTGDKQMLVLKPEKLSVILNEQDSLGDETQNKPVSTPNIEVCETKTKELIKCTHCKCLFVNNDALRQHLRDKVHATKEIKQHNSLEITTQIFGKVIAEIVPGTGNEPEIIFSETLIFTKVLVIHNKTKKSITLVHIKGVNSALESFVSIVYEAVTIPPQGTYNVTLNFRFDTMRAYATPFIITYNDSVGLKSLRKEIILEIAPSDFEDLRPICPHIKLSRVARDMYEMIIPGERPEFQKSFDPLYQLDQYRLTDDYIEVINSGFKSKDPRYARLLKELKPLIDVEDRMNCLNEYNYTETLDLLLYLEEHQIRIDIRNYDTTTNKLHCVRGNLFELEVPELSENRPSLVVGDSVYAKEEGAIVKYQAFVHEKFMDRVRIKFHRDFTNVYIKNKKFHVSFGYNRGTLKLEHQAVMLARKCGDYFFPKEIPSCAIQDLTINCCNKLINDNPQQLQAVREIVKGSASDVPYLIFGPPGTGKTMTVVEAILQVKKFHDDQKILICAPSNSAANLLCERMLRYSSFSKTELLRYVSHSYASGDIPDVVRPYCNISDGMVCHPTLDSMLKFKCVVATLTNAGRLYNIGVPPKHFSYVFIDEAGHATETETLIPITAVLVENALIHGRVILAGDPEQLGPIIHSSKAKEYGFGTSMLERMMKHIPIYQRNGTNNNNDVNQNNSYDSRVLTKLLKNYRCHPEIIALSNEEFYDSELICEGSKLSNIALGHDILINKKFPMIFHSVVGSDMREGNSPSFFNIQEIATVYDYLKQLIGCKMSGYTVQASDIAVVTPYRKQVQKIRQQCKKDARFEDLEIGSVEKLQGQEKLIVIISTVRSKPEYVQHDAKFHLGFLKNPKRMNVALTRAKALLIVIGNPNLLKYDRNWNKFIQRCKDNNATTGNAFSLELNEGEEQLLDGFVNLRIDDDIHFGRGN